MGTIRISTAYLLLAVASVGQLAAQPAANWTPTRINKVIELWQANQPAYYTQIDEYGYDECKALSATPADYISINMEHSYVDVRLLRECMRGLVDAGPVKSGHKTPAVIAVLPSYGWNETEMRGNIPLIKQIAASGVHGMLLTNAADPGAVRMMIEAIRYPFATPVAGLARGQQGNGSASYPARMWGITANEFLTRGDVWPLSPEGEFIVGLKLENPLAYANVDQLVSIPGVSFIEHGPGDTTYWVGAEMGLRGPAPQGTPKLLEVEDRVFKSVLAHNKFFLHSCNDVSWIDRGVRICTNGNNPEAGRIHTRRQMPW